MEEEMNSLIKNETWSLVEPPPRRAQGTLCPIENRWVLKIKKKWKNNEESVFSVIIDETRDVFCTTKLAIVCTLGLHQGKTSI
jgi:hypothetical protein